MAEDYRAQLEQAAVEVNRDRKLGYDEDSLLGMTDLQLTRILDHWRSREGLHLDAGGCFDAPDSQMRELLSRPAGEEADE